MRETRVPAWMNAYLDNNVVETAKTNTSDLTHVIEHIDSKGRVIVLGVYPVLFGLRVRAGYKGDMYYHIDWCCGDNMDLALITLAAARRVVVSKDGFDGVPGFSKIKPWPKDPDFSAILNRLLNE